MEGLFEKVNECFKGKTIVFTLVYNKKKILFFIRCIDMIYDYIIFFKS